MRFVSRVALIAAVTAALITSSGHALADGPSYGVTAVPPVGGVAPGDVAGPAAVVPVIGPTAPPPAVNIPDLLSIFGPYPPGAAQIDDVSYGASKAASPLYVEFGVGPGASGPTTGHPGAPPPPLPLIDVRREAGLVGPPPFGNGTPNSDIFTNWPAPFVGPPPCGPIGGNIQLLDGAGTPIAPFGLRYGLNLPEPGSALNKYDVHGSSFVGGPGIPVKPVFFTISATTPWPGGPLPSAFGAMIPGPSDVLAFDPTLPGFVDWAPAFTLGLLPTDDIHGLIVSYGGAPLLAGFGAGGAADTIWFSLAPGSPSLSPTSGGAGAAPFPTNCHAPGMGTAADIWSVAAPFVAPAPFLEAEMLGLNTKRSGGVSDDALSAMDFGHCADLGTTGAGKVDPDCNGEIDFANPGAGLPCVQDHKGDANGDGYSDADELTPNASPACTGAFPPTGGLGLTGLSSTSISAPCPGRPPASVGAMKARADIDLDGQITIIDLSIVAGHFLESANPADATDVHWEFDQDGDGQMTIIDLSIMAGFFLLAVPPC
jgi:hypothetical protein